MGANVSSDHPVDNELLKSLCEVRKNLCFVWFFFFLFFFSTQETLWRASHVRLLFAWFNATCKGGALTFKKWNQVVNPSSSLPASFVSRLWLLALAIGKNVDFALVKRQGLDQFFKPIAAKGGVELPGMIPAKKELTKEELDRRVVEEERAKLRSQLASAGKATRFLKAAVDGKVGIIGGIPSVFCSMFIVRRNLSFAMRWNLFHLRSWLVF